MRIVKQGSYWAVYDAADNLICLTVYKKGAKEVAERLSGIPVSYTSTAEQPDYIRLTKEVRSLNKRFLQFLRAVEAIENLSKETN